MSSSRRNWSRLPKEVLKGIANCLDMPSDIISLRSVCQRWRSKIPNDDSHVSLQKSIYSLCVPPYHLLPSKFYLLSPLVDDSSALGGKWIARIGEKGLNDHHIFNPFNLHDYFISNPPITGLLNLLDCQPPQKLATVYSLVDNLNTQECKEVSKKVVGGWDLKSPTTNNFSVLCQLKGGEELFFWRLGDLAMTKIVGSKYEDPYILDIAYHRGRFFVFDVSAWNIGVIDPAFVEPPVASIENLIPAPDILGEEIDGMFSISFAGLAYILGEVSLVSASNGHLYLVVGLLCLPEKKKTTMLVFLLIEGNTDEVWWERVSSLDDQIFFIGQDVAFSLPSASVSLPQWESNTICSFTQPFPLIFDGHSGWTDEGVWSMHFVTYYRYFNKFTVNEDMEARVPFGRLDNAIYTGLFFPPPAWVKWSIKDSVNAQIKLHEVGFSDYDEMFDDGDEE